MRDGMGFNAVSSYKLALVRRHERWRRQAKTMRLPAIILMTGKRGELSGNGLVAGDQPAVLKKKVISITDPPDNNIIISP